MTDRPDEGTTPRPVADETPRPDDGETPRPDEEESFPREYVERLRDESAAHRVRARDRDVLADRLLVTLARADGRLADPDDLPRTEQLRTDPTTENVTAAVDDLLARKPHLAVRKPTGDGGQGARPEETGVSLLGLLRSGSS